MQNQKFLYVICGIAMFGIVISPGYTLNFFLTMGNIQKPAAMLKRHADIPANMGRDDKKSTLAVASGSLSKTSIDLIIEKVKNKAIPII